MATCSRRTVPDTRSTGEAETISLWGELYFLECDDEIPEACCSLCTCTCSAVSRLARRRVTAIREREGLGLGLARGSMVQL